MFAASDSRAGCVHSVLPLIDTPAFNHRVRWQGGLLAEASAQLLRDFFQARR